MSLPSRTALPCWALDWRLRKMNDLTLPVRMLKRTRAPGTQLTCPQLIGTDEGIVL